MRFVIGTVVVAWAATACGERGGTAELGSETRDSAGIRIVENARPPDGSRLGWKVDSVPSVTIGELEGDDSYLLHQVRDAMQLSDGRIVVANRGSQELRVFDASGVHLATWGRRGEGPGEFSSLLAVAPWPGDSLIAWYSQQDRLSVFDLEGNFGRAFVPGDPGDLRNSVEAVSAQGTIVVSSRFTTGEAALQDGLVRRERQHEVVDAEGQLVTSLGVHPDAEMYTSISGDQDSYRFNITSIPFTRLIRTAVWAGRFVVAPNDNYEIRAYGREGTLDLIVRRDHALIQPTPAHRDAYIERRVAARPPEEQAERRRTLRERLADLPMAETFPAFDEIVADALGHLWVREYDLPGEERTKPLWTLFDPEGRVLGFVETPPGLRIHEIGESHILGRATDSLGVEYVQVWPLNRAPPN
ncbi:MAG: 6-bladed beta-propeller [Gemmatimonadota bacterium]|nr:6-bladed beta-propeller [Gemmatimonadota bacterium]MDE2986146.1 6-bladed beta-propeller [Gemmatimonadota bacterium]